MGLFDKNIRSSSTVKKLSCNLKAPFSCLKFDKTHFTFEIWYRLAYDSAISFDFSPSGVV